MSLKMSTLFLIITSKSDLEILIENQFLLYVNSIRREDRM